MVLRAELRIWSCGACLLACLAGCGSSDDAGDEPHDDALEPPADSLLSEPLGELPRWLSEVGLYRELPSLTAFSRALAYEPSYPLWSDGGTKQRFLVLPQGASIDASAADYELPLGSLLFKTFAYRTAESPKLPLPIETRLLRRVAEGWELSAYGWNQAGTDAELLELKRPELRAVLADDGSPIEHAIPSRLECRQCHESASSAVLGFSELQLAPAGELDRLAPHLDPPPGEARQALPEHGPRTSAVLGYFLGNCVHCHNGGNGAASSFDLRPEVALENLIDEPTASSATAAGIRVVPGEPEQSILYLALAGGSDVEVKDMPPLGVALRDASALTLMREWIEALAEEDDP
ncbi:MAG TPA: hypothetical protein VIW29_21555 [Polyangiaceae bacterium]